MWTEIWNQNTSDHHKQHDVVQHIYLSKASVPVEALEMAGESGLGMSITLVQVKTNVKCYENDCHAVVYRHFCFIDGGHTLSFYLNVACFDVYF